MEVETALVKKIDEMSLHVGRDPHVRDDNWMHQERRIHNDVAREGDCIKIVVQMLYVPAMPGLARPAWKAFAVVTDSTEV